MSEDPAHNRPYRKTPLINLFTIKNGISQNLGGTILADLSDFILCALTSTEYDSVFLPRLGTFYLDTEEADVGTELTLKFTPTERAVSNINKYHGKHDKYRYLQELQEAA